MCTCGVRRQANTIPTSSPRNRLSSREAMAERKMRSYWRRNHFVKVIVVFTSLALCLAETDRDQIKRKRRIRNLEHDQRGILEAFLKQAASDSDGNVARLLQTGMSIPTQAPIVATNNPTLVPGNTGTPTSQPTATPINPGVPTLSPTPGDTSCLEGTTQIDFLRSRFSQFTDPAILNDATSPQGQALQFLANNDPLQPNVCTYPTLDQRYGLAAFFFATGGATWTNNNNWLGATEECNWFGVICTATSQALNITLSNNNLIGSIPNEVNTMAGLDRMELAINRLGSTLPTGLSALTSICVMDLEDNQLSGSPFSPQLLGLPNLKQLFLSKNLFTGTIPSEVGGMTMLQDFWIAENSLVSTLPTEIGLLTSMETLFIYLNRLDGLVPTQLGQLTALESLLAYNNTFAGNFTPFGETLPQLSSLTSLRFDFNFLTGNLPSQIGALTSLTDLRFSNNLFSGTIPDSVRTLSNLRFLTLNDNFLQGSIPPDLFASFTQLDSLDHSSCFLTGSIPASIFDVPTIRLVYLNNNGFSGRIPANFGGAPLLRDFFIDNNAITGPVPDIQPGQLTALSEFTLQINLITGTMPPNICQLRTTGVLDGLFSDCGGATPEIVCDFPGCCNRCFENGVAVRRKLALGSAGELPGMEYVPSVAP